MTVIDDMDPGLKRRLAEKRQKWAPYLKQPQDQMRVAS